MASLLQTSTHETPELITLLLCSTDTELNSDQYIIKLVTLWATERSFSIFFPPTVNAYMGQQIFEYFIVYNLFHDCKRNAILTILKPEISLIRKHSPTKKWATSKQNPLKNQSIHISAIWK